MNYSRIIILYSRTACRGSCGFKAAAAAVVFCYPWRRARSNLGRRRFVAPSGERGQLFKKTLLALVRNLKNCSDDERVYIIRVYRIARRLVTATRQNRRQFSKSGPVEKIRDREISNRTGDLQSP